jgi:uncharacterized BrkB/YihY/UPF0761 family membrane protein
MTSSHPGEAPPAAERENRGVAANRPKLADRARPRADAARAAGTRALERAQRLRWAPSVIAAFEREQMSGAGLLAGGLAYRLFFWLVPFGLVVAAVASFWVHSDRGSLTSTAKSFGLSGVATRSALTAVESGSHARWYLFIAGLIFVAYFGLGAVRALRVAAFVAWRIKPTRLRGALTASAAFSGVMVLGISAAMVASWLRHHSPAIGVVATVATILVFLVLGVFAFDHLPHAEGISWREQIPGAALAACGITAIHVFTVYYLSAKLERAPKLYGTLGAATVVLLGLFLIARVVISGMFFNATLAGRRPAAQPGASAIEMLNQEQSPR